MEMDEPSTTPVGTPQVVPGDKWIRGLYQGQTIVDSRQFLFVWEVPYWPWWFFPRDHINGELIAAADSVVADLPDGALRYDLLTDAGLLPHVARTYPGHPELGGHFAIDFDALDHWFEENIEVYVHPRSPYTRVDALASSRHVVVELDGVEVANSKNPTVLFETGAPARYYLPKTDVRLDLLSPTATQGSCPYKGDANFFSALINDQVHRDIAWTYTLPRPEVMPIAGMVCFYNEAVDLTIDGELQVRPKSHFR